MKDLGIPAVKAIAGAVVCWLAAGLLFAGSAYLVDLLPGRVCFSLDSLFCRTAELWSTYWWIIYFVLSLPIIALSTALFLRQFAEPGNRVAAGGLVICVLACLSLSGSIGFMLFRESDVHVISWVGRMAVDIGMLLLGLRMYYSRAAA